MSEELNGKLLDDFGLSVLWEKCKSLVPIGTIIPLMGTTAPANYLVCDGSELNIEEFPKLADYFEEQFEASNHFGGDGLITFALPDLRNLFLRGYHGNADEELSSEIGIKQPGTVHPRATVANGCVYGKNIDPDKRTYDSFPSVSGKIGWSSLKNSMTGDNYCYTARPVNMAVLYCIKYV